ncbi:MAG: hypothetical protein QJR14_09490 [Bacillota bacterium]|nr:hypothetical protein [Bacillota bacterium]MDI3317830.1 hypothetical protein [Bacillota bacterium]
MAEAGGFKRLPAWTRPGRGDVDGFVIELGFNVAQAAIPVFLLVEMGFPRSLAVGRMLPGSALGFALGALAMLGMALKLGARERRNDVTAQVYGSNVPAMIAYTLSIMLPVYRTSHDPLLAWAMGAAATVWTGLLKLVAAPFGRLLRRGIPRPAVMTVFGAGMYTYLGMVLLIRLFDQPVVGLVALALVFVGLYADLPFTRWRIPGFLVVWWIPLVLAVAVGYHRPVWQGLHPTAPWIVSPAPLEALFRVLPYFSVILPVALYQIVQDVAAVEASDTTGDRYDVRWALAADGAANVVGGLAGSPVTNLIYSLQPPFKKLGARTAFQLWTPVVYLALTVAGLGWFGSELFPWPILAAITAWVAVEVGNTALGAMDRKYYPALLFGLLVPAGYLVTSPLSSALTALHIDPEAPHVRAVLEKAVYWRAAGGLADGFLLIVLVTAAVITELIDRRFDAAGAWAVLGSVFAWFGVMHAPRVGWGAAPSYASGWLLAALLFAGAHLYTGRKPGGAPRSSSGAAAATAKRGERP